MIRIKGLKKRFGKKCVLDGITPVSYTHLDVYKRQVIVSDLAPEELDAPRDGFSLVGSYQELGILAVQEGDYTGVIAGFDQALLDLLPVTLLEGQMPQTEDEVLVPAVSTPEGELLWSTGDTVILADGRSFTVCGAMELLNIDPCIQNVQGLEDRITLIALPRAGELTYTGFYWTDRDLGIYQRAPGAFGDKTLVYNHYALFWTTLDLSLIHI